MLFNTNDTQIQRDSPKIILISEKIIIETRESLHICELKRHLKKWWGNGQETQKQPMISYSLLSIFQKF